ncbi:hypothetical protein [Micromonospora sp. NPDC049900]|uniref:hypothetical protein n=1 Tax=unclassified Micromonospora TaxID=2617518 RepID=UPI0037A8865F
MPKLFDSSLSNHLRYPLWLFALPVVLYGVFIAYVLVERGDIIPAVLLMLSYVHAILLGRVRLAKSLVTRGKVRPEDLG